MPSLPQRGEVTICEINCDLITAKNLSDDRAEETYGGVLGFVFSPFPFRTDTVLPSEQEVELERSDTTPRSVFVAFKEILSDSFKRILFPSALNLSAEVSSERVNWHPHKHIVACISGSNQVLIRDYDNSGNVPSVRSGVASSVGTVSCGSGIRWILVDFLRSPTGEHISAISCSPDGRYPIHSF
ncbi:hypothetical protein MA16_Dca019556 [Dendrobium catenatum]|uniref:Uncharacterized protein n=1 Tax=Dendrobium catenatum TaxID=906689 RepID=A0A2I0XAH9_9ASPA|nr:hypothetical protein MA16_Dca019556 [Dendrobium catenatum]